MKRLAANEYKRGRVAKPGVLGIYHDVNLWLQKLGKVKLKDKVAFFQLLSVMISAGVPIDGALEVLTEQIEHPKLKAGVFEMKTNIQSGMTLSESMENLPNIFTDAQVGMIKSAEKTGQLKEVMSELAKDIEKTANVVGKVKGAMIYPAAVIFIMFVAMYIMLVAIIPKITAIFEQSDMELPLATKLLISMSDFAKSNGLLIIALFLIAVVGLVVFKRSKNGKYYWDLFLIHIPVIGPLNRKLAISRFARNLSNLMKSGVTILDSLEINADAIGNEVYKKRVMMATEDVSQGIPLGENLKSSSFLFPSLIASMISVGEQTAAVDKVASKIADFYDQEVDNTVNGLSKLMEPMILVVMGVVVGGMVAAIMQPIINLTDLSSVL